jgi:large subunit ribosomal protein L24
VNIKRDDTVMVITGKDKGKRGKVREVRPADNKVIIEGINIVKKHTRGRMGARQAGVIEQEAPMPANKVMVVCPKCSKGTRVGHSFTADGTKCASASTAARYLRVTPTTRSGAGAASAPKAGCNPRHHGRPAE